MKKKNDIFNPVFKDLKKVVKRAEKVMKRSEVKEPETVETVPDDDHSFDAAMSDVTPITRDGKNRVSGPGKKKPTHTPPDEEQEVMNHLMDLVKGNIDMDITFSDEYIEGSISGVNRKIMRRLKKGQVPIQDHIDLHGLTKKEAETEVRDFLISSHRRGLRCVLIVHGRGLNSPDSYPVLKERLPVWLNRGSVRKIVLAFSTAKPYDGGTGAIYVLLRSHKAQGKGHKV
ncbi:Smr/MutS family protein [Deltaproteobacteria bacterium]|nr:Smr/MutS family protein [Deltaproteobacteria bacterium]